ncbi:energy transducer TonB [Pontixanthobacter sp. CEM42]|uniref:energy transducer TonB family protein n=1 Tax=Pontixanthobacter sp. CEM42 TaxID=2792077 RepID=UPI001AE08D6C|nr:energy transducer TonB [Pontixanthobacter sp. CEM42]
MSTLMKTGLALGLAASLTPIAANAGATPSQDIVVRSQSAMEQWASDTTRDLNRQLNIGAKHKNLGSAQGIVQVRFETDASGKPVNLEVYRSSGNPTADRTATWAVRRLDGLNDAPVNNAAGARFQANIIFANTRADKQRFVAELATSERVRLARSVAESEVISLGS